MKKILILIGIIFSIAVQAQCFEIESILVDGCDGGNEGKNEMVRFKVGAVPLSVSTLTVNWPSNSWLGVCQSVSTATSVTLINSTILGCGLLKEPVGGILPANSKVLLVTSTDFNPLAQSFANLTDTLIIIFQCAGNTAGHFANYSLSGTILRTLSMTFTVPVGCTDAVTYNKTLLLKQDLTIGAQDGGAVEFDAIGNATYVNRGCSGPFIPLSVDAGLNKTLCFNATQSLTATASGPFNSINWSLGPTASGSFAPSNSLTTTYTPGVGDNGTIKLYCTLTKICGTNTVTTKDSLNITILKLPIPVISSSTNTLCIGQLATLSYSLSNAGSTGTTSALWSPGSATTSIITSTTATIYTVQVTNACGFNTANYTISAIPNPSVSISSSSSPTFCAGGTVTLTAISNVGNYLWTGGATTSTIAASTTQTAIVTSTNACGIAQATISITVIPVPTLTLSPSLIGICAGSSAIALALINTPVTYSWSTGASTSTVSLNSAGIYSVNVSNSCGSALGTVTITVGSVPTINVITTNSVLCTGQTATLSLSGSSGSVVWSNGVTTSTTSITAPGVYTATLTTTCGTAINSTTISSQITPTLSVTPISATLCAGQTITLIATSNVSNYFWNTGATTSSISVSSPGIKTVTVSNACGSVTASVNVFSNSLPIITLSSNTNSICPNETATLTVTGGQAPYSWSNTVNTGSIVTTNGGIVSVSYSNMCGTATQSINVSVVSINASLSANPMVGVKPLNVNFTNSSTGATSYLWYFGNSLSATTQSVSAQTYTAAGNYVVYLYTTNGACSAIDSVLITVLEEAPYLVIPNVFTPNGDGANEIFKIKGFNIIEFNCVIFNRWGIKLFEWNDLKTGWDGKIEDKEAVDGIYFFIIHAQDINLKDIKTQGTFSLIR
jgi:gliding motility-associated-like protein